jgi:hypothetical protein
MYNGFAFEATAEGQCLGLTRMRDVRIAAVVKTIMGGKTIQDVVNHLAKYLIL